MPQRNRTDFAEGRCLDEPPQPRQTPIMRIASWIEVFGEPTQVDILAIGPHPDDIEIGMAGSLLKWIDGGATVGLIDLTRGELGTKGTAEERLAESREAARRMGAAFRINLGLPDGAVADDPPSRDSLVAAIRTAAPRWVFVNLEEGHHPDHAAGAKLVESAFFLCRLPKRLPDIPAHSPDGLFFYPIHTPVHPSFMVDVSETFERKFEVMSAYHTQFVDPQLPEGYRSTGISDYLRNVRSLGESWGVRAGCLAAEPFVSKKLLTVRHPGVFGLGSGANKPTSSPTES